MALPKAKVRNGLGTLMSFFKIFLGLAIGFFFCLWLYKNMDLNHLLSMSHSLKFHYLLLSFAFYGSALCSRIFRWKKLLSPPLSFRQVATTLIVGYAMNVILPARLGEFFRANLCKLWYSIPRSSAFATIILERTADGITVLFCLLLGLLSLRKAGQGAEMLPMLVGGCFLFGTALLGVVFFKKLNLESSLKRFPRIQKKCLSLQLGFRNLPPNVGRQLFPMSLLIWVFEGLSLWALVKAIGCGLAPLQIALLIGSVSLSTLIPSPPGFLGTMQFAFAIVLQACGFSTESGVLAATVFQIFLIGLLTIVGVTLYLWISLKKRVAT